MSTDERNNDAKKGGGYLKEKFVIGISRFTNDEVERAIMKVTSHMLKAPNEKHMNRLIAASFGEYNSGSNDHGDVNRFIVTEIEKRTHTHNWIVVLKSFIALHRLMADGSYEINDIMQRQRNLFSARNIKDVADSPDGAAQKSFIMQYIRYLEERNISAKRLGLRDRLESNEFGQFLVALDIGALLQPFEILLMQLEALNGIEFRPTIVDNFCTFEAYRTVVVDGKRLYQLLSNRAMFVLDEFETLPSNQQQRWLDLYVRYDKAANSLSRFFDQLNSANTHWGEIIPSLKMLPASMIEHLKEVVAYGSVQTEDLTAVLGGAKQETAAAVPQVKPEPELPPPQPAVPVSATAPPATPLNPTSTQRPSVATAPALDDLFSPVAPATTTTTASNRDVWSSQPPARTAAPSVDELFGAPAPQRYSPQETSVTAPPRRAAATTDFDPFAPTPSASKAPAPAGGEVDFFFSGATPQQTYSRQNADPSAQSAANNNNSNNNSNAAPFSEFGTAGQSKPRAW